MSTQYFGFANPDERVYKVYPAVCFVPTEQNGLYFEQREIAGDVWCVINAALDQNSLNWYQPSPPCDYTQPASAFVLHQNGTITKFTAPKAGSATAIVNWGASVFTVDAAGNLTISGALLSADGTRVTGEQTGVPADGATAAQISYNVFTTVTNFVVCTIQNDFLANNWTLGAPQVRNKTKTGFQVCIPGGPAGSTVGIDYVAFGV